MPDPAPTTLRIDRWLWAARFFKTRSLAAEAVTGGKVHVDGQRAKPGRPLRVGQYLQIRRGEDAWEVEVTGLAARRGPAAIAQTLYRETAASQAGRENAASERRERRALAGTALARPTKRERRHAQALRGRGRQS